ncbi:hypothetical protein FH972_022612 [Carpinus fangiana]|uniref:Guanosine-diphosphatase n=1 Tax=Carpinus fangiana TaxID=176857 RepID=A0A5N6KSQ8_9ROSI|nr:hypothetical protein FH972_022612 [Carpinus fangiana]
MSFDTGSARHRPNLWSYISFSSANPRRSSVSLPLSEQADDPYEKHDREGRARRGTNPVDSYPSQWQAQKPRLIRYGAVAAVVVFLLWLIAPASRISGISAGSKSAAAGTTKCSKPFSPEKPLTQYALMIDAGSTGSRIHVYKFNNCGSTPELENEIFKMTPKKSGGSGLSSYDSDAEGAARSLDMLMDAAMQGVPKEDRSCTPIAVKATAGLRKLGEEKSNKILKAVRQRLENEYPFALVSQDKHGVEVMDGKDEGVYAWITTNYLLGKIGNADKTPTAAVFDLGGGSTQIVFQPTFPNADGGMPSQMEEGDHKYELQFGGRKFSLYQHSYLGYGLMEARAALHKAVYDEQSKANNGKDLTTVVNPCINPGYQETVDIQLADKKLSVVMKGNDKPDAKNCRRLTEKILNKQAECKIKPCAFNGVHQPPLAQTFAREDIYLFSYFYDRIQPLGLGDSFTVSDLMTLAEDVCSGESAWGRFRSVPDALDELKDRPESCLDLTFMFSLLHSGYEMPMERTVNIAKKIDGNELGWCLGASLPLLSKESGWTCKIKEVS